MSLPHSWLPGLGEEESRKRQELALQLLKDGVMTPLSGARSFSKKTYGFWPDLLGVAPHDMQQLLRGFFCCASLAWEATCTSVHSCRRLG